MASWRQFTTEEPEFARRVEELLRRGRHLTMATLRRDGSPRISGTEIEIDGDDLVLGMMPGALRALDLRRDPRVAVHGATVDPPSGDDTGWPGEAKIAGRAVELPGDGGDDAPHRFRIDVAEAVVTRLGDPPDHLVVESWHEGRGYREDHRG